MSLNLEAERDREARFERIMATSRGGPLLFKGDGFAHADIRSALA